MIPWKPEEPRRAAGADRRLSFRREGGAAIRLILTLVLCGQWIGTRLAGQVLGAHLPPLPPLQQAIQAGLAVFGAALILAWACELAQKDISQALALAALALAAVLPEYAVDMYFSWIAGVHWGTVRGTTYASYAAANMTGGNRLLIGLGWAAVSLAFFLKSRRAEIVLAPAHRVEIRALLIATLYSFLLPLKGTIAIYDAVFLIILFAWYIRAAAGAGVEEPELEGVPRALAELPRAGRRGVNLLLFLLAGFTIFYAAQPFAEGLVATGRAFGVDEFLLVQWLAPIASEAPEFLAAIFFALRAKPGAGMGALISSKVNQWTLLVGMIPLVFSAGAGRFLSLPLDARQTEEVLLTAAQSFFALAILADLRFGLREAGLLAVLFVTQLLIPSVHVRYAYAGAYLVLGLLWIARKSVRRGLRALWVQ